MHNNEICHIHPEFNSYLRLSFRMAADLFSVRVSRSPVSSADCNHSTFTSKCRKCESLNISAVRLAKKCVRFFNHSVRQTSLLQPHGVTLKYDRPLIIVTSMMSAIQLFLHTNIYYVPARFIILLMAQHYTMDNSIIIV